MNDHDIPDDENGRVLRMFVASGIDLTISRDVEFAHRAPNQDAAERFARDAESAGYVVKVLPPDEEALAEDDTDWDVICTTCIVPSHRQITLSEDDLARRAAEFGCHPDGWGFLF